VRFGDHGVRARDIATRFERCVVGIGNRDDRRAACDLANATQRRRAAPVEKIDIDEDRIGRVRHDIVAVDIVARRHDVDPART
jgi:hypothetical protein